MLRENKDLGFTKKKKKNSPTVCFGLVNEHNRSTYIFQSFGLQYTERRLDRIETPTFVMVPSEHVTELES